MTDADYPNPSPALLADPDPGVTQTHASKESTHNTVATLDYDRLYRGGLPYGLTPSIADPLERTNRLTRFAPR